MRSLLALIRSLRFVGYLGVVFLPLTGCAHSTLQLELDVFRGDPAHEIPLTLDQLVALSREIERGTEGVDADLERQRVIAQDLLAVYSDYFCLATVIATKNACNPADLADLKELLPAHLDTLNQRAARTKALLDAAKASISRAEKAQPAGGALEHQSAELALLNATVRSTVGEAAESLRAFALPPKTDFQGSLAAQWTDVAASFEKDPDLAEGIEKPEFREKLEALRGKVRTLASRLQASAPQLAAKLEAAAATPASRFAASLAVIGGQVSELPQAGTSAIPLAAGLSRILGNRELYDSQVDRLKDPADPVWRIVSDPANAWRWNNVFSKTWFYAEGKSDVIVVRDGPLDYRIQSASNNPSALIQSQLQISRAVTNAAITVLGSAAGVKLSQKGATEPGVTAEEQETAAVEALAGRTARVQQLQRLRAVGTRTFETQLRSLASELASAPTTAARDGVLVRLQGVLKGYKDFLTSLATEPPHDGQKEKSP